MNQKYAVVKVNNNQYFVQEGETIELGKIAGKAGDKLKFDQVLLKIDGEKIEVGQPLVEKAVVEAEVIDQIKGEKVHTFIYKAKSRYRKSSGKRAELTVVKISKIN